MNFYKSLFSKPDPNIDESKILLSILKLTKNTNQQTQLKPGDSAALLLSPNDDTFFSKFNESTKSIIKNVDNSISNIRLVITSTSYHQGTYCFQDD